MRHRKKGKILSRKTGPRIALFKNLAASLVIYEKIKTTEAKAKVLRGVVEKIITKGKINNLTTYRSLLAYLPERTTAKKVLEVLSPKYKERNGGYTQTIKLGRRRGDGAEMVLIKFV
ncbi:50S ribosomal protein L17 [Candidatus Kuenenbacteria bacterium HGW-Kuenenbacteria-1]|uniref:Large ribosomal subunit protein bL17 n=1 Tax=Candidatus Kuenenbacteria bacterium HGW-Kuenenbacteria-1 TaxID=2013812 RepID=A0A2N1UMR4_9BACT|nr:MAG: 50S ribosomal protein L17 [Candidatus Kuenenbacteria bacterium HGW-Kuenenbacteria-1]